MKSKKSAKQYLEDFLKIAPLSHALWRATEALSFQEAKFKDPVLDLGCGFGEFAGVVFSQVETGIDINQTELNEALKGKRYKKVKWADARDLPFKRSSYNTVVSVSVLEHIPEAEKVLPQVRKVLKKGGKFIFSVPTPKMRDHLFIYSMLKRLGLHDQANKYFDLHRRAFKHIFLKPKSWWKKELKNNGFEIETCHGTLSPTCLKLHELFLVTAFPSQFWKLFFGKRLMMSVGLRSKILPIFFGKFVKTDEGSETNLFIVAKKI